MKRARRLLAAAIAVVALLGLVVVAASRLGARERRRTWTTTEAVTAVEVESGSGPVDVVGGVSPETTVRRTERYLLAAPAVARSLVDGVLRLRTGCPRLAASACRVGLRIELPAGAAVRVRSGGGAVSVTGVVGAVDVATTTGTISLARASGPVTARTSGGAIHGVDLAPTFMDASTGAGPIRLSLAEPSARVDLGTGAGAIDVALPPDRYRVEATTGAGKASVAVAVDPTSGYVVRAASRTGAIRIHPR
ncbi:MAG: hypothetical protein M3066_05760 [Actinomycetota bacterium]|nr:hypothetical protein [Actinomycetota bacterium]